MAGAAAGRPEPVLEARGVTVAFGGVRALDGVDLTVREGQLVGLIGPNGAGKTTFIDAITGFVSAGGTVALDGQDLSHLPGDKRARRGLARTWQSIELFDDLSVGENLAVSMEHSGPWQTMKEILRKPARPSERIRETLETFGLEDVIDGNPADLSQGQRKLVGVARALTADPRLLLLDEPAAGLDTKESRELGAHLRQVVDSGVAMLLIDHDMGLVLSICDYIFVLDFGKVIAEGTPAEVRANPDVISAYLGGSETERGSGLAADAVAGGPTHE